MLRGAYTATRESARVRLLVPEPSLSIGNSGEIRWTGVSNLNYAVQMNTDLLYPHWTNVATVSSPSIDIVFANVVSPDESRFLRVIYQ